MSCQATRSGPDSQPRGQLQHSITEHPMTSLCQTIGTGIPALVVRLLVVVPHKRRLPLLKHDHVFVKAAPLSQTNQGAIGWRGKRKANTPYWMQERKKQVGD